jgi:hypothetical protein
VVRSVVPASPVVAGTQAILTVGPVRLRTVGAATARLGTFPSIGTVPVRPAVAVAFAPGLLARMLTGTTAAVPAAAAVSRFLMSGTFFATAAAGRTVGVVTATVGSASGTVVPTVLPAH